MAALAFCVQPTAEIACYNAGSAKTVLQVKAPANQRIKVKGWGIFFDGQTVTGAPIIVKLVRQSSTGSMTALTPVKRGVAAETIQATAQHSATAEPTAGDILDVLEIHPQSGYEVHFQKGNEIIIPGGGYLGIQVVAAEEINCVPKLFCEE